MSSNNNSHLALKYSGNSDIGLVRSENQDSFGKYPENDLDLYSEKGQLFIVADGMGGHTGGKLASSLAVETVIDSYSNSSTGNIGEALKQAIESANEKIFKKAEGSTEYNRMGTTFVSLLLKDNSGIIGHVGDSRIYKIENNAITQLTEDHTKVNEMLREGILTAKEAENYPNKSVLARALGVIGKVKIDIIKDIELKAGQSFILCSDGLAKVSKEEILEIVKSNTIEAACSKLINLANERGGKDNVTVQIITVENDKRKHVSDEEQKTVPVSIPYVEKKKRSKTPLYILLVLLVFAAGFFLKDSLINVSKSDQDAQSDSTTFMQEPVDPELSNLSGDESELLELAEKALKNGKTDNALIIYQKILSNEPMHLAALRGVNNIADKYMREAETLRDDKNFVEALRLYYKVVELQPGNEKVFSLIKICEHQIIYGTTPEESIPNPEQTETKPKEKSPIFTITKFIAGDWNFSGLGSREYEMTASGIAFASTASDKTVLLEQPVTDVVISTDIRIFSAPENSKIGIVLDYSGESFLLFCISNKNELVLIKVSGSTEEVLESFKINVTQNNAYKIKIQCIDNQLNLFSDDSPVGLWKSPEKLSANVGFYSGKFVSARISNIFISGKK